VRIFAVHGETHAGSGGGIAHANRHRDPDPNTDGDTGGEKAQTAQARHPDRGGHADPDGADSDSAGNPGRQCDHHRRIRRGAQRYRAQDAEDYDRIKSFVAEARSALQEQDTLRARSLVDKATRLVAQLAGRVSSP
jgi:hypothetical protein